MKRPALAHKRSEENLPARKRISLLVAAIAITLIAAVACGTDASGDAPASASDSPDEVSTLLLAGDGNGSIAAEQSPDEESVAAGGLDPVCVEQVLGRTATGFADITDAERTRIFEDCSADARGPRGGGFAAGFDPVCVLAATGNEVTDFADLTAEQRQAVFEQCGGDERPGGPGTELGDRERQAGGFGGAGLLENECVQNALGGSVTDITQLSQEQIQQALALCSAELDLPEGGFGGRQNGGQGRFGGGQDAPAN